MRRHFLEGLTGEDEDVRRSKEAGFDRHLVKPIDFAVLEAPLEAAGPTGRPGESGGTSDVLPSGGRPR